MARGDMTNRVLDRDIENSRIKPIAEWRHTKNKMLHIVCSDNNRHLFLPTLLPGHCSFSEGGDEEKGGFLPLISLIPKDEFLSLPSSAEGNPML